MITLEVLLLVVVLALAVFVYRGLIHSKSFARLLGGVLDVPPESDDEVIGELDEAQRRPTACRRSQPRGVREESHGHETPPPGETELAIRGKPSEPLRQPDLLPPSRLELAHGAEAR